MISDNASNMVSAFQSEEADFESSESETEEPGGQGP